MTLNECVDKIINKELNKPEESYKLIRNIHSEISFKLNSFNICIGKQSTGKTTSVIKELIKLSLLEIPDFHLIIYVSNNDSDITFNKLKDYVKIPIVKINYDNLDNTFKKFIELKDLYNKIVDKEYEPNEDEIEIFYINLCIRNVS